MKFSLFTIIIALRISVYSKSPHLFGNGCIVANNQLFMVAYTQINTEEERAGYYMDIPTITNPREKIEIEWKLDEQYHIFPGELVEVGYYASPNHGVYYVLNEISPSDFMANKNKWNNFDLLKKLKSKSSTASGPDSKFINQNSDKMFGMFFYQYRISLPKDIRIAANYSQKRYFLDNTSNFTPYGDPLRFVTIQNHDSTKEVLKTEGETPINKKGFSAAIHENNLFVTGGEFDGESDTDSIYVLNLTTLRWSKHTVSNFNGARSGCLSYSDGYLIHAFGIREGSYLSSTQFVNTKDWSLVQADETPDEVPSSGSSILVPLVVSISCGVLFIVVVVLLIFYLKRRRGHEKVDHILHPPEYITNSIWAEPRFSRLEMDLKLTTEYSSMQFDNTLRPSGSLTHVYERLIR